MISINSSSTRLARLSNIRALCITLVVFVHSTILYTPDWDIYQTTQVAPFFVFTKKIIILFVMPLFFSLSGYLFVFTHEKHRGFPALLKNKAKRLLVPYLSVCLLFLYPIRFILDYPGSRSESLSGAAVNILTISDVGHLWFLPVLFLVFVLAELLLQIGEHLPWFRNHPDLFLYLGAVGLYFEGYRIFFGYTPLRMAYIYLLWFTCGYALNRCQPLLNRISSKRFLILPPAAILIVLVCMSLRNGHTGLLLTLGIPGLFCLIAYGFMPDRSCKLLRCIDRNSFGIYLFHSPLIYITFTLIPNAAPLLVVLINFFVFGAAAYCLTNLIRRSKLRFMIGE